MIIEIINYITYILVWIRELIIIFVKSLEPSDVVRIYTIIMLIKICCRHSILANKGLALSMFFYIISIHLTVIAILMLDYAFSTGYKLEEINFIIIKVSFSNFILYASFTVIYIDLEVVYIVIIRIIKRLYNEIC